MAIYVYRNSDGTLYSWSPHDTDPVASAQVLAANGLGMVSGLPPLDASNIWNASLRTVIQITPPPPHIVIPAWQFILLFTPAEDSAIQASTDPRVQQINRALAQASTIDLGDPIVQQSLAYLVSVNLLTQANANLILSGLSSL